MLKRATQDRGVPTQAVDTEDEIEQCSDHRNEPDETNPRDSGAGIPLVKDSMTSRRERKQERNGRKKNVPGVASQIPEVRHINYSGASFGL